jgi:hypothetical protein
MRLRAAVLVLVAGCYSPRPPEGAPCDVTRDCPSLQTCVLGRCTLDELPPNDAALPTDALDVDAMIDARPDAAPLPCTTVGLACGGTATTFECGGHCWVRCTSNVTWNTASQACTGWQGALGQIDDATEQGCVAMRNGTGTWVGLRQSDAATAVTSDWWWNTSATPVVYMNWQRGAPNDEDGNENFEEQCAEIQSDDTWDDVSCGSTMPFLCERPL